MYQQPVEEEIIEEPEDIIPSPSGPLAATQRYCGWIAAILLLGYGVALRASVMTTSVRLLFVGFLIFGMIWLVAKIIGLIGFHPRSIYPVLFAVGLFVTWLILGDKDPDEWMLRKVYVKRLMTFQGVEYTWGGETRAGIDSSGLARVALWQAMALQGIKEMNPRLLGPYLWTFWWRDVSTADIMNCKYGYTRVIGRAPKLAGYDTSDLKYGDLAVAGGIHILIYIGDGLWIEASPDDGKVKMNEALADSKHPWFNTRVILLRWTLLEDDPEHTLWPR